MAKCPIQALVELFFRLHNRLQVRRKHRFARIAERFESRQLLSVSPIAFDPYDLLAVNESTTVESRPVDPGFGQCQSAKRDVVVVSDGPAIELVTPQLLEQESRKGMRACLDAPLLAAQSGGSGGVTADIDTDSNNLNDLERSTLEDSVETAVPGNVLQINSNDDNANGVKDSDENGPLAQPDPDLEQIILAWQSGGANPSGYTAEISVNNQNVVLWSTQDKAVSFGISKVWQAPNAPGSVFVEGKSYGQSIISWKIKNGAQLLAEDSVLVTVGAADAGGFRPQTEGVGYGAPFPRTSVPESTEDSVGVGIRRNGDDDNANNIVDSSFADTANLQENDLVEVELLMPTLSGVKYWLLRGNDNISVWSNADKTGPLLTTVGGPLEVQLAAPSSGNTRKVWVEWTKLGTGADLSSLQLDLRTSTGNPATNNIPVKIDSLRIYPFHGIALAFGGNDKVPLDPASGPFLMAMSLYDDGYDVHAYEATSGNVDAAAQEVRAAVDRRGVTQVAMLGHSYGGGAIYEVAAALATTPPAGTWSIVFTAYQDAIELDSLMVPVSQLPAGTMYHVNYYQTNPGLTNPVGMAITGAVNVYLGATQWGASLVHTQMDNDAEVMSRILNGFTGTPDPNHQGIKNVLSR